MFLVELLAAYTVGLAFGFGGAMELGRRVKRKKQMDESDKVCRFLNGFLAAARGVPGEGDWSQEWKDGWAWFHDVKNATYAEETNRCEHAATVH